MTAAQMATAIGRRGLVTMIDTGRDVLRVAITVTDARTVYGRTDYRIVPVNGTGAAWVDAGRVTMAAKA